MMLVRLYLSSSRPSRRATPDRHCAPRLSRCTGADCVGAGQRRTRAAEV